LNSQKNNEFIFNLLKTEDLTEHIKQLEIRLVSPDIRRNPVELDKLIDDEYFEIGKSGRVWTKKTVIDALRVEQDTKINITDFRLRLISDNIALVTYSAHHNPSSDNPDIKSLHSSVWRMSGSMWKIFFHQGTIVPD
jgi:glyoxylase I family protein